VRKETFPLLTSLTDFSVGVTAINREQAKLLPNWTSPVFGQPDAYVVQLDVFHQLHCLVRAFST
jgi:hypothetical protein